MPEPASPQERPTFSLVNRDQVEVALQAAQITGMAPQAEPILQAMVDILPPRSAPEQWQGATVHIWGESGEALKREVVACLEIVITNASNESEASKAAKGLLDILLADETFKDT